VGEGIVSRNDETSGKSSLETRSKAVFDESVDNLDGRTRSALNQARHAALAELERRQRSPFGRVLGPLTGIAAAAFVLLALFAPLRSMLTPHDSAATQFEDLEIIAGSDNIEMLQNLEFYEWLDRAGVQ
jgi:hypothetical protein